MLQKKMSNITIAQDEKIVIPDLFNIILSMDKFDVRHACMSVIDKDIVQLDSDGLVTLNFFKMIADTSSSYTVHTQPNIIAEEGTMYFFSYGSFMLSFKIYTDVEGKLWSLVKGFEFSGAHASIQFTGSYISQALGGIFSYLMNIVLDIMMTVSFLINTNERGPIVIQDILNIALGSVPTQMSLDNELYLVGGLHGNPTVVRDRYMSLDYNLHV